MKPDTEQPGGSESPKARISLLTVEKQLLGELSPKQSAALEKDIRSNPGLAAYVEDLKRSESPLDWTQVRSRLGQREPLKTPDSFLAVLTSRLDSLFPKPTHPKLAWAGIFGLLCVFLVPALISPKRVLEFRSKGSGRPEIVLEVSDAKMLPGESGNVKSGDVMTFTYRSVKPLYTQIWYTEDGGAPSLFDGRKDNSLFWPASSSWEKAPQRIVLEGNWKRQHIVVLASPTAISMDRADRILSGSEKSHEPITVFTYELLQP